MTYSSSLSRLLSLSSLSLMKLYIFTDGGSRSNPGPAATGVVIKNADGDVLAAYGEYLGHQTNNYAEYKAMISGLHKAKELGASQVVCISDSKLVVEQLSRNWKVKHENIKPLAAEAWAAMAEFEKVTLKHVLRDKNKEADAEVNKILDARA